MMFRGGVKNHRHGNFPWRGGGVPPFSVNFFPLGFREPTDRGFCRKNLLHLHQFLKKELKLCRRLRHPCITIPLHLHLQRGARWSLSGRGRRPPSTSWTELSHHRQSLQAERRLLMLSQCTVVMIVRTCSSQEKIWTLTWKKSTNILALSTGSSLQYPVQAAWFLDRCDVLSWHLSLDSFIFCTVWLPQKSLLIRKS